MHTTQLTFVDDKVGVPSRKGHPMDYFYRPLRPQFQYKNPAISFSNRTEESSSSKTPEHLQLIALFSALRFATILFIEVRCASEYKMRLLDVNAHELKSELADHALTDSRAQLGNSDPSTDAPPPKYAILSHRWIGEEITFEDFEELPKARLSIPSAGHYMPASQ
ncbi:hypothetical protein PG993_011730 [Apiospora rasikravindrae]|uniref:Uncharacterized protein n=1 Tax=Apiospora rasikravindrae TaxID=990691 RepID=A0ABR1S0H1_9PEZI